VKGLKDWAKWLAAGILALAVAAPAGAVSAAASGSGVQYRVYYVTSESSFDWNAWLSQLYRYQYPSYGTSSAAKPVAKPTAPSAPSNVSGYASQVFSLVNQQRSKAGLKPLAWNAKLANMAMVKAKDMKKNNYFDHNSPTYGSPFNMMSRFGISYSWAGENIAMGQRSPAEVMNAWMNSSGHRANILNAHYTSIGVAYYNGEWVQEFIG
jgi:uncharacterized YkwD family protein